jgi:sulfur carrier protein
MRIDLNGEPLELPAGASLADAVRAKLGGERGEEARGLAVALDGEVVPRGEWAETALGEGRRVEVLAAIQGGAIDTIDFVGIRSRRDRP